MNCKQNSYAVHISILKDIVSYNQLNAVGIAISMGNVIFNLFIVHSTHTHIHVLSLGFLTLYRVLTISCVNFILILLYHGSFCSYTLSVHTGCGYHSFFQVFILHGESIEFVSIGISWNCFLPRMIKIKHLRRWMKMVTKNQ